MGFLVGFIAMLVAFAIGLLGVLAIGESPLEGSGGYTSWKLLVLCLVGAKLLWRLAFNPGSAQTALPKPVAVVQHGEPKRSDSYEDPLRWSFLPSNGVQLANSEHVSEFESDICVVKALAMHRPTHEPWREASGDYPYSWHLKGRKRLWEIRLQLRFKKVPTNKVYFGVELPDCEAAVGAMRHLKDMVLKCVQGVVGDFYYAAGDNPGDVKEGEEMEPGTFVMPLWAFDQFHVAEVGEEPDITGDLEGIGMKRSDGLKAYITSLKSCIASFSTDKVYTFSIWGVSQFLDCMRWEAKGMLPGMTVSFSRFGLRPPANVVIYDIPDEDPDGKTRHLVSRKRYYLNVLLWSMLEPPSSQKLQELLGDHTAVLSPKLERSALIKAMDVFGCCSGREFKSHFVSPWASCKLPQAAFGG